VSRSDAGVGFSIGLDYAWLEQAAALVSLGRQPAEVRGTLHDILSTQLAEGKDPGTGSRGRAVSVISKMWAEPIGDLVGLRDRAVQLLPQVPPAQHLALHWGMALASYPFFASVAESTGRLLKLQGVVVGREVHRRVAERFGDRPTVVRATGVALGNMADWGALAADRAHRKYTSVGRVALGVDVSVWLIEALLRAGGTQSASMNALLQSPALFPFGLADVMAAQMADRSEVRVVTLGVNEDAVTLS